MALLISLIIYCNVVSFSVHNFSPSCGLKDYGRALSCKGTSKCLPYLLSLKSDHLQVFYELAMKLEKDH